MPRPRFLPYVPAHWWFIGGLALFITISELMEHLPADSLLTGYNLVREQVFFTIILLFLGLALDQKSAGAEPVPRSRVRVLVIENETLLGAGIENLLTRQDGIELSGVSPVTDVDLIKKIERFQPHCIILHELSYPVNFNRLIAMLRVYPDLNVIVLSASENLIQVYTKRQALVTESTDLVDIIRRGYRPA